MNRARLARLSPVIAIAAAAACGGTNKSVLCPAPGSGGAIASVPTASASGAPAASGAATPDEAKAWVAKLETDLRTVTVAQARMDWVYQNFITEDTEALDADATTKTGAFMRGAILEARRFDPIRNELPADVARQLWLLKTSHEMNPVPAPPDAAKGKELADAMASMTGQFGKGEYCSPRWKNDPKDKCRKIDKLEHLQDNGTSYDELLEVWNGWHDVGKGMRADFTKYVELGNEGARAIGFADMGEFWRSGYDMSPADFEADVERLWQQVKPLYDQLHCYVRAQLRKKYGADKVPAHGPIPAHLLGNMWAQEWPDLLDLVVPYKSEPSLDASKALKAKGYDAIKMVKLGESFFTSLGFDPLPDTFWKRSLFVRPQDRDVVCHASAWDVTSAGDLRVKMCIQPTETDLVTIHHELGHDFYYQQYFKLPILFQQGANDGFHEGIGDTLALSVTPQYLKDRGLIDAVPQGDHGRLNEQMKQALDKIAFLPFGLLIDKWRWDVFAGKSTPADYNQHWWELRTKYQGIAPDRPRGEEYFDPGAKYHVASSTPYIRYFLARIYQFQFHRALCKAAGFTGPLDQCSIYGNKEAGAKLKAMLAMGASKPWQEAMRAISGEDHADASALVDYFAPLSKWLADQNKGEQCGW